MTDNMMKYKSKIANYKKNKKWLCSKAEEVDLRSFRGRTLAQDLGHIITQARYYNGWVGASFNNIYWNGSKKPLKINQNKCN